MNIKRSLGLFSLGFCGAQVFVGIFLGHPLLPLWVSIPATVLSLYVISKNRRY